MQPESKKTEFKFIGEVETGAVAHAQRAKTEEGENPSKSETPEHLFEKKELKNVQRVVIRGSVAIASFLSADLGLAKDVDFFFVENNPYDYDNEDKRFAVKTFQNLEEAEKELSATEYALVKKGFDLYDLKGKSIQVVRTTENLLSRMALFEDEPEIVLYNSVLELQSEFLKPISKEEKERIWDALAEYTGNTGEMEQQLERAHGLHVYQSGELITGHLSTYSRLEPRSERLSVVLRLVDLGKRFEFEVNDSTLMEAEEAVLNKTLEIDIPTEEEETSGTTKNEKLEMHSDGYDFSFKMGGANVFDLNFYRTATGKELIPLLEESYPALARLVKSVRTAGGIRKYIEENFGKIYLQHTSVNLYDPSVKDIPLPPEDQKNVLDMWQYITQDVRALFDGKFEKFLNYYLRVNESTPLLFQSVAEAIIILTKQLGLEHISSADNQMREKAYIALDNAAKTLWEQKRTTGEYLDVREVLRSSFIKEKNARNRKIILDIFIRLVTMGDETVVNDFGEIVKSENARIRKMKGEEDDILNSEGMAALRLILRLKHGNAQKILYDLVANGSLDPRLRKVCLGAIDFPADVRRIVQRDGERSAKNIPWADYEMLCKIEKIPSTKIRDGVKKIAYSVFVETRKEHRSIAEIHQRVAPSIPPELFIPLYKIFGDDVPRIKIWEEYVNAVKSQKLKESLTHNIYNLISYPKQLAALITDKVIASESISKEHILLSDRLIKKIHFLHSANASIAKSINNHFESCECYICQLKRKRDLSEKPFELNLDKILAEAKAPSLLETKLDEAVVNQMYEFTGRGDITTDKIQSFFKAWEDPEPIFTYMAELARRRGTDDKVNTHDTSFKLFGEMLVHMDPPELEEWKKWRYDTGNEKVAAQLANLTSEQINAYAEDDFVDLGEVLVGLLPSDKPERIRSHILHGLKHDWREDALASTNPMLRLVDNLAIRVPGDNPIDTEAAIKNSQREVENRIALLEQYLANEEDRSLLDKTAGQLAKWQASEAEKRKALVKFGYGEYNSGEEIESKIIELKTTGGDEKEITRLVSLKPSLLPEKTRKFLEKYGLSISVSSEDLNSLKTAIAKSLEEIAGRNDFRVFREVFFRERTDIHPQEWKKVMADLKAMQLMLKLCALTPQLLAFNKIAPDKKKSTLRVSLDYLRKHFENNKAVARTLDDIEKIIQEASQHVGRDRLAVIFTDNPLVGISIGHFPTGAESCQKYNYGDPMLVAYMGDAYTKFCLLVDINKLPFDVQENIERADSLETKLHLFNTNTQAFLNATVARRITKIVQAKESSEAQLFLEPTYTSLDRVSTTRLLNAYVVANLKPKINIPLIRGGGSGEVTVLESRNHMQYEDGERGGPGGDGGGLGNKQGSYTMPAQAITEADYLVR